MNILIAVDLQNDFITGTLGTKEAQNIVYPCTNYIRNFDGIVLYTLDTHDKNYLSSQEGKHLPVEHCIENTQGWKVAPEILAALLDKKARAFQKHSFGSFELGTYLTSYQAELITSEDNIESITLIGLCTDICVISNALLIKAVLPEVPIKVISSCCAGVTPESHERALKQMTVCQIEVEA